MPAMFFDTVTLTRDGLRLPAHGRERTFAELGLSAGETLRLFARELRVESVPDRNFNMAADRLIVASASAFDLPDSGARQVRIAAQRVEGPLRIVCRGRKGPSGANGAAGKRIRTRLVGNPKDPDSMEVVVVAPPTPGAPGGNGGPGEKGGFVELWYSSISQAATVAAPGGAGGDRGRGGQGGKGDPDLGVPDAPDGASGAPGAPGPVGTAHARVFSNPAELWARWANEMAPAGVAPQWAAYRLRVAEYLFRLGGPLELAAAQDHLNVLVTRPGVAPIIARARVLLQRLFEHVTFSGMPRDLDVTPDVGFVGEQNEDLYDVALELLGHAQTIASKAEMQASFAAFVRLGATHGQNMLPAADKRKEQAQESLNTAMSGTDIARARAKNLDQKISELRTVISNEQEQNSGPFATMLKIVQVGVAVGQVAVGVGTGVGALVAVGQGFAALNQAADKSKNLFDLIGDVKEKLKDPSLKAFKTSFNDLGNAGKSIFHLGKLVSELDTITSNHPEPKIRELAEAQRERIILHQEIALNTQMEKEAQLGVDAAQAERDAIVKNAALSETLAQELERGGQPAAAQVLEPLLASIRQVLDALSINVFRTLRAREVYLALDPDEVVRHDLGHLHPDREQMLTLGQRVSEIRQAVASRLLQIIQWSSLVDDMTDAGALSRSPITFFFSSQDPQLLQPLRTSGQLGFSVPIEELLEEDGSQLFEVKFDAVTVILHGAKIPSGSGQSILLRQLGRWSVRRRPDASNPDGVIKDFVLPAREVHLKCTALPGGVEARLSAPANPRAEPPFSLWGRGIAGRWELTDVNGLDMSGVTKVEIGFDTQALSRSASLARATAVTRLLRAIPGGYPVAKPLPRPPTPVPPRGATGYTTYKIGVGSVAAVGAELV